MACQIASASRIESETVIEIEIESEIDSVLLLAHRSRPIRVKGVPTGRAPLNRIAGMVAAPSADPRLGSRLLPRCMAL